MKELELKLLCLGFWSPPLVRPRAIAIGKLMPEFIRQGINPVIITYENGGQWQISASVYKIPQFRENKFLSVIKLRSVSKYLYYRMIRRQAEDLIKRYKIEVIFSFSNPQESNILGAMIKRKTGIPFISYFSDPWYDNPYKSFKGVNAWKVLKIEKFIIKNSDRIIFTNRQAKELVMRKYPTSWSRKALVIPHCYNLDDYPATERSDSQNREYIFSHIGAFYKERNPEILFKIFSKLKQDKNNRKFKFKLIGGVNEYAGYSESELREKINKYNLEGVIEIIPPVDYKESLRYMVESDCLVVIDANFPNSPFLPSKLIDYAGSRNLILGITPKGSPTDEFLTNISYKSFSYDEIDQLEDYLKDILRGEVKNNYNEVFLSRFSVQSVTSRFKKTFLEALKK